METLGTLLGVIAVYIGKELILWFKRKNDTKKKPLKLLKYISIGLEINRVLTELRILTGANSAHVLGYHNGTIGFNGVSYQYISMQYESTDKTTMPMINNYQNIPAGQFSELMFKIHTEGFVQISHNEDSVIGRLHRTYNVFSSYKFRIGNSIANGTVSLSYYNKEHTLTENELQLCYDKVFEIENLINRK